MPLVPLPNEESNLIALKQKAMSPNCKNFLSFQQGLTKSRIEKSNFKVRQKMNEKYFDRKTLWLMPSPLSLFDNLMLKFS